jgi:hypothetical protein
MIDDALGFRAGHPHGLAGPQAAESTGQPRTVSRVTRNHAIRLTEVREQLRDVAIESARKPGTEMSLDRDVADFLTSRTGEIAGAIERLDFIIIDFHVDPEGYRERAL